MDQVKDLKILYVEDDATMRKMFEQVLKKVVEVIYLAKDGKEGLKIFEQGGIDIIITDISMPEMNGLEMAEHIRKSDPNIPIIVTSSYSESKYLLEAIDRDVTSYMLKPISYDLLRKKIEQVAHSVFLEKRLERNRKVMQSAIDVYEGLVVEIVADGIEFANRHCLEVFDLGRKPTFKEFSLFFNTEDIVAQVEALPENDRLIKGVNGRSYRVNPSRIDEQTLLLIMNDVTEMVQRTDELERESLTDALTGIYNRKKFDRSLIYFRESLLRYNIKFSVILFDIDHFKRINDTFGHAVGDSVLKQLTQTVQTSIRTTDVFARWGGEEFVLLLPETDAYNAETVAQNLKNLIKIQRYEEVGRITCSFGVAQYKADRSLEDFFKQLDGALYEAKEAGRDRVVRVR